MALFGRNISDLRCSYAKELPNVVGIPIIFVVHLGYGSVQVDYVSSVFGRGREILKVRSPRKNRIYDVVPLVARVQRLT